MSLQQPEHRQDAALTISSELVARYNRPGPRYTSYPTAPLLAPEFEVGLYADALRDGARSRPLSLYLHLPFCKSLCYYCGCHMMVTNHPERIEQYLGYLVREMSLLTDLVDPEREVAFVHWGGGTPTYLSPDQIRTLSDATRTHFRFASDAEISIEADPRTLTGEHIRAVADCGFNRVSIGVQDLDVRVQRAIGRLQPEEQVRSAVFGFREAGIESVSADLIYGLPFQSPSGFADTVRRVIQMNPDRLALFSYAHVPWLKKHQRVIPTDALPSADEKMTLFLIARKMLQEAGYRHVGMDHFAHPDDPLCIAQDQGRLHRNFQGYAVDSGCDLIGLGISSISQLDRMYVQNEKGVNDYYRQIGFKELPIARGLLLSDEDVLRRHVIMRLMCDFQVDRAKIATTFKVDFDRHFETALDRLQPLEKDGLICDDGRFIRATPLGRLFIRNVAMAFDAYLPAESQPSTARFSQTV